MKAATAIACVLFVLSAGGREFSKKRKNLPERCPAAKSGKYTAAGKELYEAGRTVEALECLKAAAEKDENAITLTNLASLQTSAQEYDAAHKTIKKALKYAPTSGKVLHAQARNYYFQGKYNKCIESGKKWLKHHPGSSEALLLIASSYYELKQNIEALQFYRQALELNSNHTGVLVNMAVILNALGRFEEAGNHSSKAVEIDPKLVEAHINHAVSLISLRQYLPAIKSLQSALTLRPNDEQTRCKLINVRRIICDWSHYEQDMQDLRGILESQFANASWYITGGQLLCHTPGNLLHFPLPLRIHREASRITSERDSAAVANLRQSLQTRLSKKLGHYRRSSTLRVGFVSFDYKNHPASHILLHLFDNIDPHSGVQVFAYALNSHQDEWTQKVKSSVDQFYDISSLSLPETANLFLTHELHILVDLMGFSTGGRPELLALRPAPLQVAYMGYPGTSGSSFIDYVICDPTACSPATAEDQFSEKVIFLPEPYFVAPMAPLRVPQISLDEFYQRNNIPRGKFIFCCLSQLGKLDKPMFQSWMEILLWTEETYLWLVRRPPEAELYILSEVEKRNVSFLNRRIVFTEKLPREEFLHFAPRVCDLFLDTHLYNAHTVAAEILHGGLPILTLPGETMASRVASSLLKSLGLVDELVATSRSEYVERAVHLYASRDKLKQMREGILQQVESTSTPLFNPQLFAENFISGLKQAWNNFRKKHKPEHIFVGVNSAERTPSSHTEL